MLAILRKNYLSDLHENFTRDVSADKGELIKFQKSSASGSEYRKFLKDSSTLRDGALYHSLARVSGKTDLIYENFTTDVSLEKEVHSDFLR